ncbi:TPA: multidrug export protein EmrA, partial [Klebsiella variicola subsp. variicola]
MELSGAASKKTSRKKYFIIFFSVMMPVFIGVFLYWYYILNHQVSTDDAYVTGNTNSVSSQVGGSVTAVNYMDTEYVHQ